MKPMQGTRPGFNYYLVDHCFFLNQDHIESLVFNFFVVDYDKITFNIFVLEIDMIKGY